MDDLFADLLGSDDDYEESDEYEAANAGSMSLSTRRGGVHLVAAGVTSNWLATAFGISLTHTRRRLEMCPPKKVTGRGVRLYDIKTAATYLVQPRNMAEHLSKMSAKDLPTNLQKEIWNARLAEQRWRQKAGELWASEDVVSVYADLFKLIKNKSMLWIESVNAAKPLANEQEEALRENVQQLLASIYDSLIDLKKNQRTPSQIIGADDERTDQGEDLDLEEQGSDG